MTDTGEYTLGPELGLAARTLEGYIGAVGDEGGDPGGGMELVDAVLLQRFKKLCRFPERPEIASSLGKRSDVTELFDIALLARPS